MSARTGGLLALAAFLLLGSAGGGFRVEGGKTDGFPASAGVVAVLPAICPHGVDCAWLDRRVAGELLRRKSPRFLGVEATRAALTKIAGVESGGAELRAEVRAALGEAMGAGTLLQIRIREAEKASAGGKLDPDDAFETGEGLAGLVRVRLEIRALATGSGAKLADGAAFGEAQVGSEKRLLAPMVTELLERMFPLPRG